MPQSVTAFNALTTRARVCLLVWLCVCMREWPLTGPARIRSDTLRRSLHEFWFNSEKCGWHLVATTFYTFSLLYTFITLNTLNKFILLARKMLDCADYTILLAYVCPCCLPLCFRWGEILFVFVLLIVELSSTFVSFVLFRHFLCANTFFLLRCFCYCWFCMLESRTLFLILCVFQ